MFSIYYWVSQFQSTCRATFLHSCLLLPGPGYSTLTPSLLVPFFVCEDFFFFSQTNNKIKNRFEVQLSTETFSRSGSCTRTTPGTTTPRPAAVAPLRLSLIPSRAAAARSGVRSLPQATRYLLPPQTCTFSVSCLCVAVYFCPLANWAVSLNVWNSDTGTVVVHSRGAVDACFILKAFELTHNL